MRLLRLAPLLLLLGTRYGHAQTVLGTVLEETSRRALGAVSVVLVGDSARLRNAITDDSGRFVLIAPAAGHYRLRAERLGYAGAQSDLIELTDDETITIELTMPINPIDIPPITVQQRSRKIPAMLEDFYARKRSNNGGAFFDREDIRARNPLRLTDLLRDVPGLQVSGANSAGGRTVRVGRQNTQRDCPLQVYVDGRQYRQFDASNLDIFPPADLDGVEVYKGLSEVPAEFGGNGAACGVLAVWTRRSMVPYQKAQRERGTEFRFLAALTATVLFTLLRH